MYYCGIDVAKHKHTSVIIDQDGQQQGKALNIQNERKGIEQLEQQLAGCCGAVEIGLEATGHYWLALYDQLTRRGYPVAVLNPLQVKAYRRIDLRKRKTDPVDAYWIADFVRFAHPSATPEQVPTLMQLKELSRFRFRLVEQIGDCKRKIITILDRVFPEYESLFSDVFLASSQRILQEAVTAEEFAEFDLSELAQILKQASRGRFGLSKAEEIQTAARQSIGISFLADAVRLEMSCLLNQIRLLEEQVEAVEAKLEELMGQLPQFITTIPGIGLVTGAMLLAEIGDVQRFETLEDLVAYAGIDPAVYQSGKFKGDQMHMSKRGSPFLRNALWQAATAALLHNSELKAYYDKKRNEGKHHGVALGAVCRKLLARVYVVLKKQRPYVIR